MLYVDPPTLQADIIIYSFLPSRTAPLNFTQLVYNLSSNGYRETNKETNQHTKNITSLSEQVVNNFTSLLILHIINVM